MDKGNIFCNIPQDLGDEFAETLAIGKQVRIERIVSRGHCSPADFWYNQQQHEFVILLQGEAVIELQQPEQQVRLMAGDYLLICAFRKHRVLWTCPDQDSVWLALFYDP